MKYALVFAMQLGIIAGAKLNSDQVKFTAYINKFGKEYESIEEWNMRFENFKETDMKIEEIN